MQDNHIKYHALPIQTDLRRFVKQVWTMEAKPNTGDYFIYRTYASLHPTILFAVRGNVQSLNNGVKSNLLLVGQTNQWCRFKASSDFKILGITLHPFTIPLLFNIPSDTFTNKIHGLNFISQFGKLNEFCQKVAISNFGLEHINASLSELVLQVELKDENIISLLEKLSSEDIDVSELTSEKVAMSKRNFERKFKYYSGFTPKAASNLIRLKKSFNSISFRQSPLSDTAFEQSYFDQAHFSNEFKKHTGFQPKVFAKNTNLDTQLWKNFVDFFQFLSICPPVLCTNRINSMV